jgi:hypothetical protein
MEEEIIIYAYLISNEQKDLIVGEKWNEDTYFNPVFDNLDRCFVSKEVVDGCNKPEFEWLKDCEYIIYNPKILNIPI